LEEAPELYRQIAALDWAQADYCEMHGALEIGAAEARETRTEQLAHQLKRDHAISRNIRMKRLIHEKRRTAMALETGVDDRLGAILTFGLEARAGKKLVDEADVNTYVQIRSRWLPKPTAWHVCERCDVVFKARRATERDSYRCAGCHNKRLPGLRPARDFRKCSACPALFLPSNVRQVNCHSCQADSVNRSRHPDRAPTPGTDMRTALIDVDAILSSHDPTRLPAPYWKFLRRRLEANTHEASNESGG
jgi:hypothetical protein